MKKFPSYFIAFFSLTFNINFFDFVSVNSDDVEFVEETQAIDFVDGCITTPELIKKIATSREVGSSVKRNLTKVFEEMPPKK